jgi:hypothetical protein
MGWPWPLKSNDTSDHVDGEDDSRIDSAATWLVATFTITVPVRVSVSVRVDWVVFGYR